MAEKTSENTIYLNRAIGKVLPFSIWDILIGIFCVFGGYY